MLATAIVMNDFTIDDSNLKASTINIKSVKDGGAKMVEIILAILLYTVCSKLLIILMKKRERNKRH